MKYEVDTLTVTKTKIRVTVPNNDYPSRKVIILTYFRELLTEGEVHSIAEFLSSEACPSIFCINELETIPEYDFNHMLDIMRDYNERHTQFI